MEQKNRVRTEPHYYSERLKQKLNTILSAHATVVEAPSGYGKTTAIRDFLEAGLLRSSPVYWFTAADETPAAGFRRLCLEIDKIDSRAGGRLQKIGLPNAATVGEACDALRSIKCSHQVYLVIDNFQFLNVGLTPSFFTALVEHGGEDLHIIIITQVLGRDIHTAIAGHGFLHITVSDLRLDAGDILRYFTVAGAKITMEDAETVARYTEGWIIAVYLQFCAFRDTGAFSDTAILSLVEHLVWDALTNEQQTFLLRLSLFETFTIHQACALTCCDPLPGYALEALQSPFIRYERAGERYELHSILSELLNRKRGEQGASFRRECLLRAGDYCRDEQKTAEALSFYEQAEDYERMLSLDLSNIILEDIGNRRFPELALQIARKCSAELKHKYPLSMLQIAYALLTAGMDDDFGVLMDELYPTLEANGDQASLLLGEWTLLNSYRSFPNIDEMTSILKQADSLFSGKCSRVITPDAPWCYAIYAPFLVLHTAPGEAEREADALEKYIDLYTRLTGGHGSGEDVLFRLELAHYRGELHEAEILAYKALHITQGKRQKAIQLAVTLHLAEIALEKADTVGWRHAIASLESTPGSLENIFALPSAMETALGLLLMELDKPEEAADWLKSGDFSSRQLPRMKSDRMMVYLGTLLKQGKYARLVGAAEAMYPDGVKVERFQDEYIALITAVGVLRSGDRAKASELVCAAVRMALPDRLFSPLLYYGLLLDGLVEECVKRDFPEKFAKFETARESFRSAYSEVYPDLTPDELPDDLTAREREVALLAAEGLRNGEIAARLVVTESTVRAHLRIIFQKLDIDRRARLVEKLK